MESLKLQILSGLEKVHPGIFWIFFAIASIGIATMSALFMYHWRSYGESGDRKILYTESLYFAVLILLFLAALLFLSLYTLNI